MPLTNVLSIDIRPKKRRRYFDLCHELAEHAKNKQESTHWTAHETLIGRTNRLHFVIVAADFAEIDKRGAPEEMFGRVLGEKRALEWMDELGGCVESEEHEISIDRPELSYVRSERDATSPFAMVTVAQAQPGHADSCEELLRKIAEAIPKVNDGNEIISYQTVIGDLSRYWTVRPLESIADLDKVMPPAQLLDEAFGASEGGLIFRSGLEAIAQAERNLVAYRPELSNPG